MPNFWTKTTQYFDEAFKGPRTIDIEFDSLIKEMNDVEKGIAILKQVLTNIDLFASSFKSYFFNVSDAMRLIFSKKSPFSDLIEHILSVHKQLEIRCDLFTQAMKRLYPKTTEWSNFFQQAKLPLENREKVRKIFDHYDGKMESLYRCKSKKVVKGNYLERNQDKFYKAALNYIEMSEEAYHLISDIMNRRYDMINPVLMELVIEQREFLKTEGEISMKINMIEDKFKSLQKSDLLYVHSDYNPGKYIRGGLLLQQKNTANKRINYKQDELKKSFMYSKKKSCNVPVVELIPKNEKTLFRRKMGLIAEIEQMKGFNRLHDNFSNNVHTLLPTNIKKDKGSIKKALTESNMVYETNLNRKRENDWFNDFF